jgi:general secretion pathway protein A
MHIDPLAAHEVKRYLQTRWARAAAQVALPFSDDAMELVANASAGIPRVVNVICDAALVNACGAGIRNIGVKQIEEVLQDLCLMVPNHAPLTGGASRANSSSREFPALSESANVPAIRSKSVERYMPETRQVPKFWRIGSWFRTTTGAVK